MIELIPKKNYADPHAEGFNPTIRCTYYSDALGHSTKRLSELKKKGGRDDSNKEDYGSKW